MYDVLHGLPKGVVGLLGRAALAGAPLVVAVHVDGDGEGADGRQVGQGVENADAAAVDGRRKLLLLLLLLLSGGGRGVEIQLADVNSAWKNNVEFRK